jgi:hypothetical protein
VCGQKFANRFTHVPTALTRGPQQVKPPGPRKYFKYDCHGQSNKRNLHFKSLSIMRGRGVELHKWAQVNMDVHLARRLRNIYLLAPVSDLQKMAIRHTMHDTSS